MLDQDLDSSTTQGVDILAGGVEGESPVRFKSIFNAVNFDRLSHHDELLALFIELVEDLDEDSTVDQLL